MPHQGWAGQRATIPTWCKSWLWKEETTQQCCPKVGLKPVINVILYYSATIEYFKMYINPAIKPAYASNHGKNGPKIGWPGLKYSLPGY